MNAVPGAKLCYKIKRRVRTYKNEEISNECVHASKQTIPMNPFRLHIATYKKIDELVSNESNSFSKVYKSIIRFTYSAFCKNAIDFL